MLSCTVSTSRVQWIAQPFFTFGASFTNSKRDIGTSIINNVGPSGGIIIRHVDADPLLTVMLIQGNLINESFNVSCLPVHRGTLLTNDAETEEYISGKFN